MPSPTPVLLFRPAPQNLGTEDDPLLGRRVLVVEDDGVISMLLEEILADLGCEVVGTATRVEIALGMIGATTAIDVAVLDVNLHGTRSDPVADALAACGIPFVFLTGYGGNGIVDAYRDRPILQKPFSQQDLVAALAASIGEAPTSEDLIGPWQRSGPGSEGCQDHLRSKRTEPASHIITNKSCALGHGRTGG